MDSGLLNVKEFLDEQYLRYCHSAFIEDDPVQIPHLFSGQQNREIAGFFAAVFAWGQRKTIIAKSKELVARLDNNPFDFVVNHTEADFRVLKGFRHRTFGEEDAVGFVRALAAIYRDYSSLDEFLTSRQAVTALDALRMLRKHFESVPGVSPSTLRHVANADAGSAAKRLNMFLRWMVRSDSEGVDFGMWKCLRPKDLLIPLDLHVGNVSRELGILTRSQNDLKAVLELTEVLKQFDPDDPVKYDFALFSLGVSGIKSYL
jgi:TIGR02757 family protein